jgi:hypothetical protein
MMDKIIEVKKDSSMDKFGRGDNKTFALHE